MTDMSQSHPATDPGMIDFELTDLDDARLALEELPEGVGKFPALAAGYWEARRRRPLPSDRALQGSTIEWLLALPQSLQPRLLCDRYPRAANALAAAWASKDRAAALDNLLVDRRGNRRGFPPEVRSELLALRYALDHPEDTGLDRSKA